MMTKIIGITGSIGSGKSMAARIFGYFGFLTYDADFEVHRLFEPNTVVWQDIYDHFSGAVPEVFRADGTIDRDRLGRYVLADLDRLALLESMIHPHLKRKRQQMISTAVRRRHLMMIADVPLLFEGGFDRQCSVIIVTVAPLFLRRLRVLQRPGMNISKFEAIGRRQWRQNDKVKKADMTISTGLGFRPVITMVKGLLSSVNKHRSGPYIRLWRPGLFSQTGQ